jgi:hypothetical protein
MLCRPFISPLSALQLIPRRRLEVVNSRRDVEHLQVSLHDQPDAFSEFMVATLGFIAISD